LLPVVAHTGVGAVQSPVMHARHVPPAPQIGSVATVHCVFFEHIGSRSGKADMSSSPIGTQALVVWSQTIVESAHEIVLSQ
jgi:hypothetical protein